MSIIDSYRHLKQLQQQGEIALALTQCQAALQRQPNDVYLRILLTTLLAQHGQLAAAQQLLDEVLLSTTTWDADLHSDIAGTYIFLHQPAQALTHLNSALLLDTSHLLATIRRGIVLLQSGYYAQAITDFIEALRQLPSAQQLALHINLARCYLNLRDFAAAHRHIDAARALDGSKRAAWLCVAVDCHIAERNFAAAEQVLQHSEQAGIEPLLAAKIHALIHAANNNHARAEELLLPWLHAHPQDQELLSQLIDIACIRGRYPLALTFVQQALCATPQALALWLKLAHIGRYCLPASECRQAAEQAMQLAAQAIGKERAQALSTLAQVEADAEQFARAEALYCEALQTLPQFIPALLGLGYLYLQWGQLEAALKHFTAVSQLDPYTGHSALMHARTFPQDPTLLQQIAEFAQLPTLQGPVAAGLLFDLAQAWEQRQDYPQAFQCARIANSTIRQQLAYNAEQHSHYYLRLQRLFTRDFFTRYVTHGHPSTLPVFIVGLPRSGTTLVEQLLGGHPDIHVAGEIGICSSILQKLKDWEHHLGSRIEYPECLFDLTPEQLLAFAEQLLTTLRQFHPSARYIVDKLPHNFENIGLIRLLFPRAKIIHVQRDPLDVAVSTYFTHFQARHTGLGYAYDLEDIAQHILDYQRLMEHWATQLDAPPLCIHYETLVMHTEQQCRALLAYLELDWHDAILQHQQRERAVRTASIGQVRQAIYQSSTAKWRHYAAYLTPVITALNTPRVEQPASAESEPPLSPGLFSSAMALLHLKQYPNASTQLQQILVRYPKHAAANHMLGLCLYRMGASQQALSYLELSVALHAGHADWFQNLALVYAQLGMQSAAAKAIQIAKQLAPNPLATQPVQRQTRHTPA